MPGKRPFPASGRRPGGRGRGGGGGSFRGKQKRPKSYWKQRRTVNVAPVPRSDSDQDDSGQEEEEVSTNYDKMVDMFVGSKARGRRKEEAVESGSEEEEEDGGGDGAEKETVEEQEQEQEEEDDDDDESEEEAEPFDPKGDPFTCRYSLPLPQGLEEAIEAGRFTERPGGGFDRLGTIVGRLPDWAPAAASAGEKTPERRRSKLLLEDDEDEGRDEEAEKQQARMVSGEPSSGGGGGGGRAAKAALTGSFVKEQLLRNVRRANPALRSGDAKRRPLLTRFQEQLFSLLNSYRDVGFFNRTADNGEEARFVYALHALNHVLKTRSRILLNNAKLAKKKEEEEAEGGGSSSSVRDQGLCRPKVVFLVPFRESARRIVDLMCKLLFEDEKGGKVANRKRFDEEFGEGEDDRAAASTRHRYKHKPDDFYETFAGNVDDGFRIGLAVTRKALKLYTDFYSSDVIVASPLGLRMAVGSASEGGEEKEEEDDKRDFDFLSSIEVLVADQADVFMMQNWEHVGHLFDHLNLRPARPRGADFTRVRMWALDGKSARYRQTVLLSGCHLPEARALLARRCSNYMGSVRTAQEVPGSGQSALVAVRAPVVFRRVECGSLGSSPEDRLAHFQARVMPEFRRDTRFHTLVFVPSYFDFVQVRNWFDRSDLDFLEVCEYTRDRDVAKARDHFFHGETHFLLYTERAHFYRRFALKGIRHLVFYQLPQYPHFFSELCNMMMPSNQNRKGAEGSLSVTVLYTRYDVQRLAAAVGSARARAMLAGDKNVHMFVTEN